VESNELAPEVDPDELVLVLVLAFALVLVAGFDVEEPVSSAHGSSVDVGTGVLVSSEQGSSVVVGTVSEEVSSAHGSSVVVGATVEDDSVEEEVTVVVVVGAGVDETSGEDDWTTVEDASVEDEATVVDEEEPPDESPGEVVPNCHWMLWMRPPFISAICENAVGVTSISPQAQPVQRSTTVT